MEQALLLNASFEPLQVIHWKRAICLVWLQKVEILEVYERKIRGVSLNLHLPAVLRLSKIVRTHSDYHAIKFSRANIFLRDSYRCQYCSQKFRTEDLTFDHVVPIAQGGKKCWENIVTACWRCNNRKSGQTPAQAGLKLLKIPRRPVWRPYLGLTVSLQNPPEVWRDYLYWNVQLEQDT